MKRPEPKKFEKPYLLLCEGESDKKVFDRLIERYVPGRQWQVVFAGGRSQFGEQLVAMQASPTFAANVRAILVVSDKDENEDASFAEVQRELEKAEFQVPAAQSVAYRRDQLPDVVILMLPIRSLGNLETLCKIAARDQWGLHEQIGHLIANSPARDWGISKLSKSIMEIYLAVTCRTQPDTSFSNHWSLNDRYHLDLSHNCFEELVRYLQNFPQILLSPVISQVAGTHRARRA